MKQGSFLCLECPSHVTCLVTAHPQGISLQPPLSGSLPSLNFLGTVRISAPIALQMLLCYPACISDMLGAFRCP